jgi:predicted small secreted protein
LSLPAGICKENTMWKTFAVLATSLLLGGCAAMNQLGSDVSSFGSWPAERRPAGYTFERLPSQQQQPERQLLLEEAARPALQAAGFREAADPASAEFSVQLGARVTSDERWLHDDGFGGPLSWRGPYRYPRFGFGLGYGRFAYAGPISTVYEREVVLLIRDRRSGQTVYETRAVNQGQSSVINSLLPAMFAAAMKDFPAAGVNPRRVVTDIQR